MALKKKYSQQIHKALKKLSVRTENQGTSTGLDWYGSGKKWIVSSSPIDGSEAGKVQVTKKDEYELVMKKAQEAFRTWREVPAPKRGEVVRQIGNKLREYKEELGCLVSYEMGKSYQEGLGEVQEMIDIADFAVGLSRQLYGLQIQSERPYHRMMEQYHPLGVVGIISAFNFPVAVWSWNAFLAMVCGDVCVWKPSEKTPLCAIACQKLIGEVFKENNVPEGVSCLVNGNYQVGEWLSMDARIPLVSATGSTRMGKIVAQAVASRLGKSLLELGGNNAIIVTPSADLKLTITGAVFGAVGTAGQRCTTTRRLIVHSTYKQIRIGNPLNEKHHVGPLIDEDAVKAYEAALRSIIEEGGNILTKSGRVEEKPSSNYVYPVIAEAQNNMKIVQHETFAPILYLMKYSSLEEAIEMQNAVPQGLSSAIMTNNMRDQELFLSAAGSDCGIANVNIGTSGAEIGGAFGGEKETGGGRESGSDAWKVYMRRQTNTINFSDTLPLAQGIQFDL
jgi:aldehyde dehydrogenase (NAD+)